MGHWDTGHWWRESAASEPSLVLQYACSTTVEHGNDDPIVPRNANVPMACNIGNCQLHRQDTVSVGSCQWEGKYVIATGAEAQRYQEGHGTPRFSPS